MATSKANSKRLFTVKHSQMLLITHVKKLNICLPNFGLRLHHLASILSVLHPLYGNDLVESSYRFVMNEYMVFLTLGWNSLVDRCSKLRAVMIFKIIHKIVDIQHYN